MFDILLMAKARDFTAIFGNKMKFLHWHFVQPLSIAQQCGVTDYH